MALCALVLGLTASKELLSGETLWQEGAAYRAEGRHFQAAGELQRATAAYRHAVSANPQYAEAYNDLGVALESAGDLLHAEEAYKMALRLKPELAAVHSNLALLYEEGGRLKEAAEHWAARVHGGPPDDPWVLRAREKLIQYKLPVPESAEQTVKGRKDRVHQAILAGRAHREAKRWAQAQAEFQRALSIDPASSEAVRLLKQAQSLEAEDKLRTERQWKSSQLRVEREAADLRRAADRAAEAGAERRAEAIRKATQKAEAARKTESKRVTEKVRKEPPPPKKKAVDALALADEYAREKARTRKTAGQELYARAVNSMREGQYQSAADLFRQILVLDPKNRDARSGLERAEKALAKKKP